MENLFFWKDWKLQNKIIFFIFFSILIAVLGLLVKQTNNGFENIVDIHRVYETENITVPVTTFQKHLFDFTVNGENYLIKQRFDTGKINLPDTKSLLYLCIIAIAATLAITVISGLKKVAWYSFFMSFFILWLVLLKTDFIGVFGYFNDYFAYIAIAVYLGISFLFHAFLTKVGFLIRFITFSIITGLLSWCIQTYSIIENPLIVTTNFGIIIPSLLTFLFIILTAQNVISSFATLINNTYANGKVSNLGKFALVSLLYLTTILLYLLNKKGYIDFQIIYLNPFVLFAITTLLGIWGHRARSIFFKEDLPFSSFGVYLYISLALIASGTIYFSFLSGNTALGNAFEDIIIYAKLGLGLGFFLYMFVAHANELQRGVQVDSIYQSKNARFYISRIIGITVFFIIIGEGLYPLFQKVYAGHQLYKAIGYYYGGEETLSNQHFRKVTKLDKGNPIGHYVLSNLAYTKGEFKEAIKELATICSRQPSEFAFIRKAELEQELGLIVATAPSTLVDGLQQFPTSGYLAHNLAYVYQNFPPLTDSSYFYYKYALQHLKDPAAAKSNLLTLYTERHIKDAILPELKVPTDDIVYEINKLAAANSLQLKDSITYRSDLLTKGNLSSTQLIYLNNFALAYPSKVQQDVITELEALRDNPNVGQNVKYTLAFLYQFQHAPYKAKALIDDLINNNGTELQIYYNDLAGQFLYLNNQPELAADYFSTSAQIQLLNRINQSLFSSGIAYADAGNYERATNAFKNLASIDPTQQETAKDFLAALQLTDITQSYPWVEYPRAQLTLFNPALAAQDFEAFIASLTDLELKAYAITRLVNYFINLNETTNAIKAWEYMPTSLTKATYFEATKTYLKLLALQKSSKELLAFANEQSDAFSYKDFYTGVAYHQLGDSTNALQYLKKAHQTLPMDDEVIIYLSNFYADLGRSEEGYNTLISLIQEKPVDIALNQCYIERCLELNLPNLVKSSLEDLSSQMDADEFVIYSTAINERLTNLAPAPFSEEDRLYIEDEDIY